MHIINARLRNQEGLHELHLEDGLIRSIARQTEAPTLLVVRKEGGLFSDDETALVNYRVQGDRYIVDTIFDKAILIAGVGRSQDRVTITRTGK